MREVNRRMKRCHVLMYHTTEHGVAAYTSSLVQCDKEGIDGRGTNFVCCPEARRSFEVFVALSGVIVLLECPTQYFWAVLQVLVASLL